MPQGVPTQKVGRNDLSHIKANAPIGRWAIVGSLTEGVERRILARAGLWCGHTPWREIPHDYS